jgi:acyl-CoA reductase-like NAD-dependent aldehyde dehydrogenase
VYSEPCLFVGGKWLTASGETLSIENPATELPIGEVRLAATEDVDAAVSAAREAFDAGPWPRLHPVERRAALLRLTDAFTERRAAIADRLVVDLGCPVSQTRSFQIDRTLDHWRYIADLALTATEIPLPPVPFTLQPGMAVAEPIGVVAAITAYNYPFMIATWKLGPALAAGCTVVWKPAEIDPLAAYEIMRAIEDADLPPGVVNLVVGGPDTGSALVRHPGVDAVSFTGSVPVGTQVSADAAPGVKRVTLELGGKSPAVVLDDADVDPLIPKVTMGYLLNSGQACGATTRLLVARSLLEEVTEKVVAASKAVPMGDPTDERNVLGPLVSARQRKRVEDLLATVEPQGGRFVTGGGRPERLTTGYYIEPTVVVGLDNSAAISREEVFGPVLSVIPFDADDEAVHIANDSPFGLAAVIYGRKRSRTMSVARRIRAGTVCVGSGTFNPAAPIGGYKHSGIGREGGVWGLSEFQEVKHLSWA